MVCWPSRPDWDWVRLEQQVLVGRDSRYESAFVDSVLRHVDNVNPARIKFQHEVRGRSGRPYRIDFAILGPDERSIAIEVDGFQKTARSESEPQRMRAAEERQNDLVNAGWTVLRFTNLGATEDPATCIRQIEQVLAGPPASQQSVARPQKVEMASPTKPSKARLLTLALFATLAVGAIGYQLWGTDEPEWRPAQDGRICPTGYPVKANQSGIYHEVGWRYYDSTYPARCYQSPEGARRDGYRESQVH